MLLQAALQHRSDAREAEGGALLRRYTDKIRIEGSNPSHSAKQSTANRRILRNPVNASDLQIVVARLLVLSDFISKRLLVASAGAVGT